MWEAACVQARADAEEKDAILRIILEKDRRLHAVEAQHEAEQELPTPDFEEEAIQSIKGYVRQQCALIEMLETYSHRELIDLD